MKASRTTVATAISLATASAICQAQIGRLWSPSELVAESDLVIICEHLETLATGVRTLHPELNPGFPVLEVESRLRVLAQLKGNQVAPEVRVRHYRPDWDRLPQGLLNGGSELVFAKAPAQYIVYLKQAPDGTFRPTTGYTFPDGSAMCLVKIGSRPTTG